MLPIQDNMTSLTTSAFIVRFDQEYERFMHDPRTPFALYVSSIQFVASATHDVAIQEYVLNRLLVVYPNKHELYYFMGYIWREVDAIKALVWFQMCYRIQPEYVENVLDLTKILFDRGWYAAIYTLIRDPVIQRMDDDRVQMFLACMYIEENRHQDARRILERLLVSEPTTTRTSSLRWMIRLNLSKVSPVGEALTYLDTILDEMGNIHEGMSKEVLSLWKNTCNNYLLLCDYVYTDPVRRFTLCQRMNQQYPRREPPLCQDLSPPRSPTENIKIRIGYVSYAFSYEKHAVSNFILPILAHHDLERFEVVLFTQQAFRDYDPRHRVVHFQHTTAEECARLIQNERIDILFDLDGHVVGNRLDAFAYGPAPIQITYLGFPNSTGLDCMQYRLTDRIADPPGSAQLYSETKLYLPRCFLLFESVLGPPPIPNPKKPDWVVFGAVNKESKNSPETLATWKTLLARVPHTMILIKLDAMDSTHERRAHYCRVLDISEERLITFDYSPRDQDYLDMFRSIDVVLDTFPYSGTTTTCNALYCSIPVVTMYHKDYHAHNVSASLLTHCGYPEWIAHTAEEYVEIAAALCRGDNSDTDVHDRFMKSMDPVAFMRDYETLLQSILHVGC